MAAVGGAGGSLSASSAEDASAAAAAEVDDSLTQASPRANLNAHLRAAESPSQLQSEFHSPIAATEDRADTRAMMLSQARALAQKMKQGDTTNTTATTEIVAAEEDDDDDDETQLPFSQHARLRRGGGGRGSAAAAAAAAVAAAAAAAPAQLPPLPPGCTYVDSLPAGSEPVGFDEDPNDVTLAVRLFPILYLSILSSPSSSFSALSSLTVLFALILCYTHRWWRPREVLAPLHWMVIQRRRRRRSTRKKRKTS
jgi:hypothetical protein